MIILEREKTDIWEDKALKVLSNFSFDYPVNIDDMSHIYWRYGIKILSMDKLIDIVDFNLKAFSTSSPNKRKGIIYIKDNLSDIDKKVLLAEEFCHIYTHAVSQLNPYINLSKMEKQAKRMAAYLLIPSSSLQYVYNVDVSQEYIITELATHFNVPVEFMYYRFELSLLHLRYVV